MGFEKNVASQKWVVFVFDRTDNTPKTGDAANITAKLRKDSGTSTATNDVNPTELEDGFYEFDLTQAETNAGMLHLLPESSTADIQVVGVPGVVFTQPAYFEDLGIASDGDLTKVNTLDGHTAQTGDSYARIGAPAGASIAADLVVIDNFVDGVESTLGAAGAGLTGIPWNASWDAEVESEVDDALIAKGLDHLVFASVTGNDIADNSIIARLASSSATADWDSFVNTDDSLQAIADSSSTPPTAAAIADAVWDEAIAGHVAAGSFGVQCGTDIDAILVDTATLGAPAGASHAADIAAIKAETVSIVADTGELQTDWVDGGRLDLIVDSILLDTGTTIPGTITTLQADTDDIQTRLPSILTSGTADSGTTTTMVDAALSQGDTDYWAGSWIRFTDGTVSGQTRLITAFTPGTDTVTFAPATTQAVANNNYEIIPAANIDLVNTVTTNTDMVGTDSAALASVCTEARLAELDAANLPTGVDAILVDTATLGAPAGATHAADIAAIKGDTAATLVDTTTLGAPAGATHAADIAAIKAETALILTDTTLIVADTAELQGDWVDGGRLDLIVDSILVDTATIGSLNDLSTADINAQVLDVLNVDTFAQPGQESPAATTTLVNMVSYLYKGLRNKYTQTSTEFKLYADDGSTVDQKSTISDDTTTFTRGEIATGP